MAADLVDGDPGRVVAGQNSTIKTFASLPHERTSTQLTRCRIPKHCKIIKMLLDEDPAAVSVISTP